MRTADQVATRISLDAYDRAAIADAVDAAVAALGGWDSVLGTARRILLKPNFVVPEPADKWATTHPEVYLAVADLLIARGHSVTIGESPAFGSARAAVRAHGALDECRDKGIEIITFGDPAVIPGLEDEERFDKLSVTGDLQSFDAVINLPKVKVHQQMVFTGAVKNLYGCVPGKRKAWRHFVCKNDPVLFGKMLLANAAAVAPVLHVGDGIIAMHKRGPRGGLGYPLGQLLVSRCPLLHDWVQCCLMGIPPLHVPQFQAVPPERRAQLAESAKPLLEGYRAPTDFLRSHETPVRFSPYQMLRSVYRSTRQKIAESS